MKKTAMKQVIREFRNENMQTCMLKLLIECWNAETPHFGGCGPHRYNGRSKTCAYCNRPINWKPINAGYAAALIDEEMAA